MGAAGWDRAGRPAPAGHRGTAALNLSGEMTRARNPPAARAPGLRMHDFTPGQSSPRLPEALGPGEQTPALFPRTDSSGSFHRGGGRGWLREATWQHLTGFPTPPRSMASQTPRTSRPPRTRVGLAGLGGADRRPLFGQRAPGTGPSPAFYMTAGPVPCACLVASRHGGFSGGRRLRAQPGWRSQRSCRPGRPGEVPAPWGPHGGAPDAVFGNGPSPEWCPPRGAAGPNGPRGRMEMREAAGGCATA